MFVWGSLLRTHVILRLLRVVWGGLNCGSWHRFRGIRGWVPNLRFRCRRPSKNLLWDPKKCDKHLAGASVTRFGGMGGACGPCAHKAFDTEARNYISTNSRSTAKRPLCDTIFNYMFHFGPPGTYLYLSPPNPLSVGQRSQPRDSRFSILFYRYFPGGPKSKI